MPLGDVIDFLNELVDEFDIPHVYIGALASNIHGRPRETKDADLVVFLDAVNVDGLVQAIEDAGVPLQERRRSAIVRQLEEGLPAKIMWDDKYSFDLRLGSLSLDYESLENAVLAENKEGRRYLIPPPEEVIVYKLARFSGKDREDIKGILDKQESLDWDRIEILVESLAREIGNSEIFEHLDSIKVSA